MDVHAAVERADDVAREAQDAGEADVDAVAAEHLLAAHALGSPHSSRSALTQ